MQSLPTLFKEEREKKETGEKGGEDKRREDEKEGDGRAVFA